MHTFWQFFKSELKANPFATLRTFIYGMGGWLFATIFSAVVTVTTPKFWLAQAGIGVVLLVICTFVTVDTLRFKQRIEKLRGEILKRADARWDGAVR